MHRVVSRVWGMIGKCHTFPPTIMSPPCNQCGGATAWDDDAASAICMTCGTLVDASQSVFTDGYDIDPATVTWEAPDTTNYTLKSLRNPNWSLAGQGKEVRENQNAVSNLYSVIHSTF